jgi:hypothetical protein
VPRSWFGLFHRSSDPECLFLGRIGSVLDGGVAVLPCCTWTRRPLLDLGVVRRGWHRAGPTPMIMGVTSTESCGQ